MDISFWSNWNEYHFILAEMKCSFHFGRNEIDFISFWTKWTVHFGHHWPMHGIFMTGGRGRLGLWLYFCHFIFKLFTLIHIYVMSWSVFVNPTKLWPDHQETDLIVNTVELVKMGHSGYSSYNRSVWWKHINHRDGSYV